MKQINEIMKHTDAYKQLKKRKETTITENVSCIRSLADEILEIRSSKYTEPVWFEIQKDDNPDIWDDHLDALVIDAYEDTDTVILKVTAYVEHKTSIDR